MRGQLARSMISMRDLQGAAAGICVIEWGRVIPAAFIAGSMPVHCHTACPTRARKCDTRGSGYPLPACEICRLLLRAYAHSRRAVAISSWDSAGPAPAAARKHANTRTCTYAHAICNAGCCSAYIAYMRWRSPAARHTRGRSHGDSDLLFGVPGKASRRAQLVALERLAQCPQRRRRCA
jgi:hypothetical protein